MKTLGIVGASGLVGESLVQIVANKDLRVNVRLFGHTSAGQKICFKGKNVKIEPCEALLEGELHYAMFMANELVASRYVPELAERGVTCIDNSSYFRLRGDVPLVVTSINGEAIGKSKIIANPNCSTIQTVIAVNALKSLEPIKMTAVTYQSVSGAGREGIADLERKSGYGSLKSFKHPIADNLIPYIGSASKNGLTSEEWKLVKESRKILGLPKLKVNSFCARVPVTRGHGVFVNVLCRKKTDVDEVKDLLEKSPDVLVMDGDNLYPMPINIANTKYVGVGRITRDPTNPRAVNMFVVADNLLRGAAYNAYEILEEVIRLEEEGQRE